MSVRVVLFTRSSRPSGAQMAWRLYQSGIKPVAVIVEKRSRMIIPPPKSSPHKVGGGKEGGLVGILFRFGIGFLWRKLLETIRIRIHFYLRKHFPGQFKDPVYLSVEEWALDHPSVRVYEVKDHNSSETQDLLWRLEPDVGILTNTRRIKKEVLKIPRHGFLNLHLSALPRYAGLDSIFWALYHGEKEIGVTVHSASEEIDRGDLVIQRRIPVSILDDETSLYQKALWLGTHLMARAVAQIKEGRLETIPQDPKKGSYFTWPTSRERSLLRKRWKEMRRASSFSVPDRPCVLHLITRMTRGGAQENTLATCLGLQKRGYEVALVTGPSWVKEGEILSEALEAGLEVVILPELVRDIHPWKDLVSLIKLSSWLVKNRYVIIHTHSSKAGFLGRLAGRMLRVPVIVHTPHGHVFHSYFHPWKEKLFLSLERKAADWADRLIALTRRCRDEHLERGVGTPEQWVVIPSGVDEKHFQPPARAKEEILARFKVDSGKKIVGFVGRLAPVKGVRYLIEALPQIFKAVPEAYCFLVGDGGERTFLQQRIQELGLEGRVTLAGHQKQVSEWMSLFDVLVVPSLNEGMGRVIVEGGLLGRAIAGTKVGGIPDLIEDGETGLLVEARNPGALAGAVTRLLCDPSFCERLGRRLREKVLNGFTEHQMIEKIHYLYQEVLKEKGTLSKEESDPEPVLSHHS